MKAYYEKLREENSEIEVSRNYNHTFAEHFHMHVEILVIKSGKYTVTLNGKQYFLKGGDICFSNQYDIHGYVKDKNVKNTDDAVIIIPYKYSEKFNEEHSGEKVLSPVIHDEKLAKDILEIADRILLKDNGKNVKVSGINLILALLSEKLTFVKEESHKESFLVKSVLEYLSINYRSDVSLKTLSKELGYTKEHISRTFHEYVKKGIPEYVNDLRLNYLEQEIKKGDKKITEVIFDAGFKSIQSYYRNKDRYFKKI